MEYLFSYVYWFVVMFTPVAICAVLPLAMVTLSSEGSRWRRALGGVGTYVVVAAFLGFFAYAFIPAQYTRDLELRWPPGSSSLGEIHAVFLQRTANPEAIAPENAPHIRQMVYEERWVFFRRWLTVTLLGFVTGVLILVLFRLTRRSRWMFASDRNQR